MTYPNAHKPFVAIACGGTGGHLFPGLAVAEQLAHRGCDVALLISPKDVDQQAVKAAKGMEIVTLPAVALQNRNYLSFARSFWKSLRASKILFKSRTPHAVLAMGGFTSAPPVFAARKSGVPTFLHESNTIPGRANRWLARFVNQAFVGFPSAISRLRVREATVTGTPVRAEFQPRDPAACRAALGLEPNRPTVLVMGGSQGASGINDMILSALPLLAKQSPRWQWFHLTGPNDADKVKQAYAALGLKAVVHSFFAEMDLALGAASVAVSRAGASSLAELAAMRVPSLLVPYPHAADNHQFSNARAFEETGAVRLLEQKSATPEIVADLLRELVEDAAVREKMQAALAQWHAPKAAEQIAEIMLKTIAERNESAAARNQTATCGCGHDEGTRQRRACLQSSTA